jgi:hypothetical protein
VVISGRYRNARRPSGFDDEFACYIKQDEKHERSSSKRQHSRQRQQSRGNDSPRRDRVETRIDDTVSRRDSTHRGRLRPISSGPEEFERRAFLFIGLLATEHKGTSLFESMLRSEAQLPMKLLASTKNVCERLSQLIVQTVDAEIKKTIATTKLIICMVLMFCFVFENCPTTIYLNQLTTYVRFEWSDPKSKQGRSTEKNKNCCRRDVLTIESSERICVSDVLHRNRHYVHVWNPRDWLPHAPDTLMQPEPHRVERKMSTAVRIYMMLNT